MHDFLIKSYVSRLTNSDIDGFAKKNGIELTENELDLIHNYIVKDWRTIIYGNPRPILDELRSRLNIIQYRKIENLYLEFKDKYKNYL